MRDTAAMIAGMAPVADGVTWHFCTTADAELAARARPTALASFAEAEGMSLVLSEKEAVALGFDTDLPMARITLTVQSALDGVGLTAAVATALATALAGRAFPATWWRAITTTTSSCRWRRRSGRWRCSGGWRAGRWTDEPGGWRPVVGRHPPCGNVAGAGLPEG